MDEAVVFRSVTLRHRRSFGPFFEDFSVEFGPGLNTVLGGAHSGKSTLLLAAAGLLQPRRGSVRVLGRKPRGRQRRQLMRRLGYLPQDFGFLPRYTVAELLAYGAWLKEIPRTLISEAVERTIELVGLQAWRNTVVSQAAPWVRQRAGIAQQLVHDPAVLLLDHPFMGIRLAHQPGLQVVLQRVAEQRIVVLTASVEREVPESGQLLLLHYGHQRYRGSVADFDADLHRRWLPMPEPEDTSDFGGSSPAGLA